MGWVVAYCTRRLQEGLKVEFAKAGYRVSAEQWAIVTQLSIEDGLSQQVLADRFHKSKVAAFHLITKLEEQGLIVRRPNPEDGRSNLIHLTDKGREMVSTLVPLAQHNLDRALAGISPSDVERTRSVLFKMALNLKQP
jgi:DNA-binding MarR family transcriptional regulator